MLLQNRKNILNLLQFAITYDIIPYEVIQMGTNETFGKRLQQLRAERELSQKNVAEGLDIAQPTYALYEAGKREPSFDNLIRIARFFAVTADYLLGLEDSRTHDGQAVLEKLGLSDEAINVLSGKTITDDSDFESGDEDAMTEVAMSKFIPRIYSNFFNIIASRRPTTFLLHFFTLSDEVDKAIKIEINENDDASNKLVKSLLLRMKRYDAEQAMGYNAYLCNRFFMKFLDEYMESTHKPKGENNNA
jgi:transcriptional regulator with XRE-family HTH domain